MSCSFPKFFHRWSKWETIGTGGFFRGEGADKRRIGTFFEQSRTCSCCNKIQLRKTSTSTK